MMMWQCCRGISVEGRVAGSRAENDDDVAIGSIKAKAGSILTIDQSFKIKMPHVINLTNQKRKHFYG